MTAPDLPFLDLTATGFSTRSDAVLAARTQSWCARTPFGLAVLRHRQAGQLLRDRRLRQGSHAWPDTVGLSGEFAAFWRRSVISLEGPPHKAVRAIALKALSEDYILSLMPAFTKAAEDITRALPRDTPFDVIEALSEPFSGRAITTLLALPDHQAAALASDASTLGLAMGIDAPRYERDVNAAYGRLRDLADTLLNRAAQGDDPSGLVGRLWDAAGQTGNQDRQMLNDLVVISIFGGVDTTRAQLGFAAALFAAHPDQWTWLRDHRGAVPQAIEEIIRFRPTTTWSTREALEDFELDGVPIAKGETLHIFVHASATDPEAAPCAGFDIRADRKTHFGFGGGAHHCLGQFIARTDMTACLRVCLKAWARINLDGEPDYLPDSGNTSPRRLRIAPVWN